MLCPWTTSQGKPYMTTHRLHGIPFPMSTQTHKTSVPPAKTVPPHTPEFHLCTIPTPFPLPLFTFILFLLTLPAHPLPSLPSHLPCRHHPYIPDDHLVSRHYELPSQTKRNHFSPSTSPFATHMTSSLSNSLIIFLLLSRLLLP